MELVGGRYRLGPVLGEGGFGAVHRAIDTRTQRPVAVKVFHGRVVAGERGPHWRSEVDALAALRHPNVLSVYDCSPPDAPSPYLVMELFPGSDLGRIIGAGGPLPEIPAACALLLVATGLAAIHEAGFLHGDLKPPNVMIDREGRVVIADFGVATLLRDPEAPPSAEAGVPLMGTPAYMSPEQLTRSERIDGRSDIFALGAVAYATFTGERAFRGSNLGEIARGVIHGRYRDLRERAPHLAPTTVGIVERCLRPDPAQRWPDAPGLVRALSELLGELRATDPRTELRRWQEDRDRYVEEMNRRLAAGTRAALAEAAALPPATVAAHRRRMLFLNPEATARDLFPEAEPSGGGTTEVVEAPVLAPRAGRLVALSGWLVALVLAVVVLVTWVFWV